jgi:hypothetical protein
MSFANRQRLLIADDDADTLAAYVVIFSRLTASTLVPCRMVERWREKFDACKPNLHRCWWRSPRCHHPPKRPNRLGPASIIIL